ncbi:MAG: YjjG family noncanonical pyrimidine nucleotidase [Clostridia bacterium]|nr:YjjG family noncanonical pyrimidine nucleotidase [Clostridia bacterium]
MITTLFWDIDDTLLDFKRGEAAAIRQTLSHIGIAPTEETVKLYSEINEALWKRLERGEVTRDQVLVGRFEQLFSVLGFAGDAPQTQELYFSYLGEQHDYITGAQEILDALCGKYRMYAVSNGTTVIQNKRLAASGLDRVFDRIFLSQAIGAEKPAAAFFDACFAALPDVKREEVLIIGDSLTSDIRGGEMAGLKTCWFNPRGKENNLGVHVDHEIAALSQLLTVLAAENE